MKQPPNPELVSHAEPLLLALLESAAGIERSLDRALANTRGISFSEYRLITVLAAAPEQGMPRIELAQQVGLTASAVTRALKPLAKLGYVDSQSSPRDARQSLAQLTAAGRELLADSRASLQDVLLTSALNRWNPRQAEEMAARLAELSSDGPL